MRNVSKKFEIRNLKNQLRNGIAIIFEVGFLDLG